MVAGLIEICSGLITLLVFFFALRPAFQGTRKFLLIPVLLLVMAIYGPYILLSGSGQDMLMLFSDSLLGIVAICLICDYFIKALRKKGVNVTRQISLAGTGWIVGVCQPQLISSYFILDSS